MAILLQAQEEAVQLAVHQLFKLNNVKISLVLVKK
jgi:hypothetical protein